MPPSQTPKTRREDATDGQRAADKDTGAETADEAKALHESAEEAVTTPGGFKNDPDDPTNPNEAIERHRRKLRP